MTRPDWTAPDGARMLAALDRTWSALERKPLGPWTLRRGGGGGKRASSVQPRGALPDDLDAALAAAVAQSAAWDQPACVQLGPEDATLDAALEARGWPIADSNVILAAPAAAVAERGTGGLMAVRVAAPLAALDDLWDAGAIGPARRAVMEAVAAPKVRLMLRDRDRPAGAAFVACDAEIAVVSALFVDPAFRRRGVARAAMAAAGDWAVEHGAATLALAVACDNAPARALYDALGFVEVCGYRYRRAP
jgi:GNAT superfamily N-acetyltransferase